MLMQLQSPRTLPIEVATSTPIAGVLFDCRPASFDAAPALSDPVRAKWTRRCIQRLRELRPAEPSATLLERVNSLWLDVAGCDPLIAAEMEHETWDWTE